MSERVLKPLAFVGSARKDLQKFPKTVRDDMGFNLYQVQQGKTPDNAKPLKGFNGVMELVERYNKDAFRAVYLTNIGDVVYVLHCFKKRSKIGIKTPKKDIDLIRSRLQLVQRSSEGDGQ